MERWLVEVARAAASGTSAGSRRAPRWRTSPASPRRAIAVLADAGWDVEDRGLYGAPEITVVSARKRTRRVGAALQMLGLGRDRVIRVATDDQGRMRADALGTALAGIDGPDDRLRAGRQREHRRRSIRCAEIAGAGPRRTAAGSTSTEPSACGRRARRPACASVTGLARRRLVDDRQPQVAQRAVRLRASSSSRDRDGPSRRDDAWGPPTTSRPTERTRRVRLGARVVPPRARLRRLGRAPVARPRRARGRWWSARCDLARRLAERLGGATRASRSSTTSCSTRCSSASRRRTAMPTAVMR